jgi:HK97 family phage major capsid protein
MKMSIKVLRQKRADLVKEAQDMFDLAAKESRGLTEAEQKRDDAITAELADVDAQITRVERQMERQRSVTPASDPNAETAAAAAAAAGNSLGDVMGAFMARYRNLPAAMHQVQPGQALSAAQVYAFGDFLQAVRRATRPGATADPRLVQASLGANETISEDAGFLVERDVADGLLRRTFAIARIANKVRRIPISAQASGLKINALKDDDRRTGSRWGGLQVYHIGEGDSLTPSRPKFRQMNLSLKKMTGLLYATDEMLQDSVALAGIIQEAFPEEFSFMLDDVIFEGSGSSTGLGFMNAGAKVKVDKEVGQAALTILFENVTKMFARLPANSIERAEWWVNQDTMPALMALHQVIGTGGVPVFLPPGGLSGTPYATLFGRPVIPMEYCNTLGTEGDIVLADPTSYVMIDKGDIQYATSIHVAFLTNEQAFRFIYRYDGQPVDDKPITPFKGSAKQSTFITLGTRA